jgi:acyl carrier protein
LIEETLTDVWAEILEIEKQRISVNSNFFQLGGHSLRAVITISKIHQRLNVKMPLVEVFRAPTIRELAGYIKAAAPKTFLSIELTEKKEYYALSSAQRRIYILQQMAVQRTVYNMPMFIELSKQTDLEQLEVTFRQLILRHESLRISIEPVRGRPVQRVHHHVAFAIEYYEAEAVGEVGAITREFVRPFDLSRAPLLRVGVIKIAQGSYILMTDMHHIISDGISRRVLMEDFRSMSQGEYLPGLKVHYKDYVEWQERPEQQQELKRQEAYWLKEFGGEKPVLDLPADFPRPEQQSFEGSRFHFEIEPRMTDALRTVAHEQGATLYMVLLAATSIFLSKLSGQTDIVIGTPVAGRPHAELEKVIGMFVNTLALRNFPDGEKKFTGFLQEIKKQTLAAFQNQDYPFDDLVEKTAENWDKSRNPLFDVMLSYQNIIAEPGEPNRETVEPLPELENLPQFGNHEIGTDNTSKFDLGVNVSAGERLFFTFEYNTKLFKRGTIELFSSYFQEIISSITGHKDLDQLRLKDINISHGFEDAGPSNLLEGLTELEF